MPANVTVTERSKYRSVKLNNGTAVDLSLWYVRYTTGARFSKNLRTNLGKT